MNEHLIKLVGFESHSDDTESRTRLGTVVDQLLLLCYHYDPKAGRYGAIAIGAMRAGGVVTLLALGALVFAIARSEQRTKRAADRSAVGGA
jgi:protein SCO1/2